MKDWLRRVGGVAAPGLTWAALWALAGALIPVLDPMGSLESVWVGPPIGVQPGLLGGVLLSVGIGVAGSGRGVDQVSYALAAALGAAAGLAVGVLPLAINEPSVAFPLWLVGIGGQTLLGAISALVSLTIARMTRSRRQRDGNVGKAG